jgi:PAS domain S-box-containing protein
MAMRVGELARRTGVGVSTLRAWERRFALLQPERSATGQRLYTEADVDRVAAVSRLIAEGLTLSAAAGRVAAAGTGTLAVDEGEAFLLHQIAQAADQGIWVSQDGRTRYANRRMAELMHCSIDELMSRPVLDFVDAEGMETLQAHGRLVRDGQRQRYEIPLVRSDGSRFIAEVRTTPLRDAAGAYKGAVAVVDDVTERRQAETDGRFQTALLDAIGEAVLASETDGTIVYANPAAERLLGWRAADLIGQNGLELLAVPGRGIDGDRIHARLLMNRGHTGDVTLSRRDGTQFQAHLTASPVLDAAGQVVGVIGLLSDSTAIRQREQVARDREQQAETVALLAQRALRQDPQEQGRLLTEAVEAARRVLHADNAALFEMAPGGDHLVVRVASPHSDHRTIIPSGSRSFAGYTALADRVVAVADVTLDRRFDIASPPDRTFAIVSAIAAPVRGAAGVSAVLIATRTTPHTYDESATHFMQNIADVVGIALRCG